MRLSDYFSEALPLTRNNFIFLQQKRFRLQEDMDEFDNFCERMNANGGYGALD